MFYVLVLVILCISHTYTCIWGFPGGSDSKACTCSIGDLGLIPGLGRSPEEGNGYSLQYSCLSVSAAAAKSLQSCPTLCNPTDGISPGSHIPGFSRQEHWSGLPFPSPMHASEK